MGQSRCIILLGFKMPFRLPLRRAIATGVGGGLAIAVMVYLAALAEMRLTIVPFTTSIVLVMAAPESQQSQPRNIIGGHVISALCGLGVLKIFGNNPLFAALAVGLSIVVMQLTRTLHPPAGMNALLMVTERLSWTFILMPVFSGAVLLVIFASTYHRLTMPGLWPRSWWSANTDLG